MNKVEEQKTLVNTIKNIIMKSDNINNINKFIDVSKKPLEIMKFTGYSDTDISGRILTNLGTVKGLFSNTEYENVRILGIGSGNYRGIYFPIKTEELVVVGWLDINTPIILGSINDYLTLVHDNIPAIKEDEMIISPKKDGGSIIYIKENDDITIVHPTGHKILIENNLITISNSNGGNIFIDDEGIRATNYKSNDNNLGLNISFSTPIGGGINRVTVYENGLLVEAYTT